MSAFVLVLAAEIAVDGGSEAASASVAVTEESLLRLDGTWKGTWEGYGEAEEYIRWRVTVRRGKIRVTSERRADTIPFALVPEGRGKVRVVIDGMGSPGIYRADNGRLIICASVWGEKGARPEWP
jgi:hypothetical protein